MDLYYIYKHTINGLSNPFYIGMSKKDKHYSRSNVFNVKKRNDIWGDVYIRGNKNIVVDIIYDNLNFEKACEIERSLIAQYGKLYDKTGVLANLSDGGILKHKPPFKVAQYDFKGNFIKLWGSVMEAAFVCNIDEKSIYSAVGDYGNKSCNGFLWKKIEGGESPLKNIPSYECFKKIYQFDRVGTFVAKWESASKAALELSIDRASINNTLLGNRKSAGGYLWSYCKDINIHQKIVQYDLNMVKIKEYSRLSEVVAELNLNSTTAIRNCFKGKQKQAYGFKWAIIK